MRKRFLLKVARVIMVKSADITGICITAWLYVVSNRTLKRNKVLWRFLLNVCNWIEKPFDWVNMVAWKRHYLKD